MSLKILVVGTGGREHALLWKLHEDAPDAQLFITRGNGGTAALATSLPLDPTDSSAIAAWAESQNIDLTVVGPETAFESVISYVFERRTLPLFGPTKAATAIESSKAYAKQLMQRAHVPTAEFQSFTEFDAAEKYIRSAPGALVVKASGLAAGKGALVCNDADEAVAAARSMLQEHIFGSAGQQIVIEEKLSGEEVSVLAITDGYDAAFMIPAQDHKRIGEGDTGANTGGMGVYAPVSIVSDALLERVRTEIFLPILEAMRDDDRSFRGCLYAGIMLTTDGPKVIEFNARFGDPETQVVLPMLQSSLLELMLPVARGARLPDAKPVWRKGAALTTVLASAGYPETYEVGKEIRMTDQVPNGAVIFHAGTKLQEGKLVTSGGRVLAVTGLGGSIAEAAEISRTIAESIQFEGKYYRRDIGWREIPREKAAASMTRPER